MDDKKEVVKKETTALRVSGEGSKPVGFEEVDTQQDIIMPRLAILQATSQMVKDGKGKMGDLANSLSKENFGNSFEFIPLFLFKTRCKFDLEQGLICQSRNGLTCSMNIDEKHQVGQDCTSCKDAEWEADSGPLCSLVYNFPALNVNQVNSFPISISLMRSSSKAGKQLLSLAMMANEDFFSRKYKITTEKKSKGPNEYAVASIELVGRCSEEEYASGKLTYQGLRGKVIEVSLDEEAPDIE